MQGDTGRGADGHGRHRQSPDKDDPRGAAERGVRPNEGKDGVSEGRDKEEASSALLRDAGQNDAAAAAATSSRAAAALARLEAGPIPDEDSLHALLCYVFDNDSLHAAISADGADAWLMICNWLCWQSERIGERMQTEFAELLCWQSERIGERMQTGFAELRGEFRAQFRVQQQRMDVQFDELRGQQRGMCAQFHEFRVQQQTTLDDLAARIEARGEQLTAHAAGLGVKLRGAAEGAVRPTGKDGTLDDSERAVSPAAGRDKGEAGSAQLRDAAEAPGMTARDTTSPSASDAAVEAQAVALMREMLRNAATLMLRNAATLTMLRCCDIDATVKRIETDAARMEGRIQGRLEVSQDKAGSSSSLHAPTLLLGFSLLLLTIF